MGDDYGKLSKFPRLILLCGKPRERQISPLKVYLKHKTLTCVRRVSPSPSPCPTAGASHFENEWEPPNSRLPKALAEYVRQLAISISPADRLSPATVLPQGERGLEGTVLAALWVQGQEKETSFLDSAGRVRETKGKGGGGARRVRLQGPRQPREGGHTSTVVVGPERRAVLCLGPGPNSGCPSGAGDGPGPVSTPSRFRSHGG